jgi:hypothetical protein
MMTLISSCLLLAEGRPTILTRSKVEKMVGATVVLAIFAKV